MHTIEEMTLHRELRGLKILFIQPSQLKDDGSVWKSEMPWLPRLALPQLVSLTPEEVDTDIIDEYLEEIDFNVQADLVALSATTVQAPRAYQIADEFKKRGIKTIIGGIHASLLAEEAQVHTDSILIGEAEDIWINVLYDLKCGELKNRYESSKRIDITDIPSPDLSRLNYNKYKVMYKSVQTTRGCPHNCGYCSVTNFFGKSYRHRDIKTVIREIENLHTNDIFFVDDNIAANPARAKELFKALKPLKISWVSQSCMSIAYNDELLALAKESGCCNLMIGFESISSKNLESVNKSINKVEDYFYVIDKLHRYGITVMGLMVFGFDHDDESVFEKTAEFMEDSKVDFPCYWILTPYPGTPLYTRMEAENRIIDRDWSKYDCSHVVFKPKLISPEALSV